ncbi:MAG: diacylglycerol kinase [Patescibacteria group bacterium]|nr:diacylglycerol kinase [Patescibacteria group bacterium]MDD5567416.1 diacylglycerol kinase [Patescibacteria group bacterium]
MPLNKLYNIFRSFGYAGRGVWYVVRRERTFQIHILAAAAVVALLLIFPLETWETVIVILVVALVLVLEIINTAVEKIIDVLKPRIHFYVQIVKDLMAAAVLVVSFAALVIGLIIFWPHVFP